MWHNIGLTIDLPKVELKSKTTRRYLSLEIAFGIKVRRNAIWESKWKCSKSDRYKWSHVDKKRAYKFWDFDRIKKLRSMLYGTIENKLHSYIPTTTSCFVVNLRRSHNAWILKKVCPKFFRHTYSPLIFEALKLLFEWSASPIKRSSWNFWGRLSQNRAFFSWCHQKSSHQPK